MLIGVEHAGCGYGGPPVIHDVNMVIDDGAWLAVVGPSGSGKSTLLRLIVGALTASYGSVERRPGIRFGFVPQLDGVDWNFPATVADVVAMALPDGFTGRTPPDRRLAVVAVLDRTGLSALGSRPIGSLSAGERQRVFIARSLVVEPDLLVLDEPGTGIDIATRYELFDLLASLHRDGQAIVFTTHDVNAVGSVPRVVCFNRTVIGDGPASEVLHPYVLERTYGAAMRVLRYGDRPVVFDDRESR